MQLHKRNLASALVRLAIMSTGCRETCTVPCGFSTVRCVAIGFTRNELVGMVETMYKDNSFTEVRATITFDSTYLKGFFYPRGDSTSDTILFGGFSNGIEPAVKFYIPATGDSFRVTNFKIAGNLTQQVKCHQGTPSPTVVGQACNGTPYLQSYTVNGQAITLSKPTQPEDTAGYIYLHK